MWQASNGSVSAPTMASTTTPSCIRWPHRMPGSQYWPRLIDSAPPATATSQSPSLIACAADTIACSPLPHSRFTVNAGRLDREAAVDRRDPAQVHVPDLGVDHVAEDRVPDLGRVHAGPADRLAHHRGGEVAGRDGGEAAAVFADRGPHGGQDQDIAAVFHAFLQSLSPHMSRPPLTAQICPVM